MLSDIRLNSGTRAGFNAYAFDGHLPDPQQAAGNIVDYMMSSFRDAKLVREHRRSQLGGVEAYNMALTYTLEVAGRDPQTIYEEVWLIPRETNYVTISYGTLDEDRDPDLWRDIRRALASVTWQ